MRGLLHTAKPSQYPELLLEFSLVFFFPVVPVTTIVCTCRIGQLEEGGIWCLILSFLVLCPFF
jgi:hypothetical protein